MIVLPAKTETGQPVFCVLVKRTYDIRPGGTAVRSEQQAPLVTGDVYHDDGNPETTSIADETDLIPYKIATDVVLNGKAYAPAGKAAKQVDVRLQIGAHQKTIRVIGDRRCVFRGPQAPSFTEPVPFTDMDIRYERAYGGMDAKSVPGIEFRYPRNPIGTGLALKNVREVVDGLRLPNLEDPNDLLTPERLVLGEPESWNRQPLPQGFGWFHRAWYPRCSFVGAVPAFVSLEEPMREELLGLVPKNQVLLARQFRLPSFDIRFNSGASPGLAVPFLAGDEPVRLSNLTPEGELSFSLPGDKPHMTLDLGQGPQPLKAVLQIVRLRPEEKKVELTWRGALEYPGLDWLPNMKRLTPAVE